MSTNPIMQRYQALRELRYPSLVARLRGLYITDCAHCPRCDKQMNWLLAPKGAVVSGRYCIWCDYSIAWRFTKCRVGAATDLE